jgi:hypothetical protein
MRERPLDVTLIAIYLGAFSTVLWGIILFQWLGGHIHGAWPDKLLVLPLCFLLSLLPGVIALGLWVLDNAARLGAMLFALLHAIIEMGFFFKPHIHWPAFTLFRIGLDGLIIACLCRPGVRKVFSWSPVRLSINRKPML